VPPLHQAAAPVASLPLILASRASEVAGALVGLVAAALAPEVDLGIAPGVERGGS
jgi:hypothetical protein